MSETLNIKHKPLFSEILILIKYRLSFSVVLSSVASYLLAFEIFSLSTFTILIIGGFLVVGSSNGFNQIIERERAEQEVTAAADSTSRSVTADADEDDALSYFAKLAEE